MTHRDRTSYRFAFLLIALLWIVGCGEQPDIAPPRVKYGVQSCSECKMIVGEERFATALIEEADGVRTIHVYDDAGCMIEHQKRLSNRKILARYVHDFRTLEWLDAADASYLKSAQIQTPMASGIVAFAFRGDADAQAKSTPGQTLASAALWGVAASPGSSGALVSAQAANSATKDAAMPSGNADAGKAHFNVFCIACHGPGAVGIPNLGLPLNSSPFVAVKTDAQLLAFIKVGRMPTDPDAKTKIPMPPKGGNPAFSDAQLLDIIAYIRLLQHEAAVAGSGPAASPRIN